MYRDRRYKLAHNNAAEPYLRERLTGSSGSEFGGKTERLVDGKVSFDHEHGRAGDLRLLEHVTALLVQYAVNATNRLGNGGK